MGKVILAMVASACAIVAQAGAAQAQTGAATLTTIVYPDKGPSGMSDLPMGSHRIPGSNVFISGHQKGGAIGPIFGLFGILVQSAANADAGKRAVQDVQDDLRFDVAAKAAELTGVLLNDEGFKHHYTLSPNGGGGTLSVVPYAAITFVNESDVRPYVVLKTTLDSGASGASRTIKYFCCEGKPLPLAGENGLSANNGERLKSILASELETALHVMLLDRSQPYPRDDHTKVTVRGYFPFNGRPLKYKGYDLGRYNDYSVFEFNAGGGLGGVHIAEQDWFDIKGGKAD